MSSNLSSTPTQSSSEPFKAVQLREKLVLTVLGVAALIGFIMVLMRFAQPTPTNVGAESRQIKPLASKVNPSSAGPGAVASASLIATETSTTTNSEKAVSVSSNSSSQTISPSKQASPKSNGSQSPSVNTPSLQGGLQATSVVVKKSLNVSQPSLSPSSSLY